MKPCSKGHDFGTVEVTGLDGKWDACPCGERLSEIRPHVWHKIEENQMTDINKLRDEMAREYFHRYHGADEEYEGWESEDYQAGWDAGLAIGQKLEREKAQGLSNAITDCMHVANMSTNGKQEYDGDAYGFIAKRLAEALTQWKETP